jgi:hypothetical protein
MPALKKFTDDTSKVKTPPDPKIRAWKILCLITALCWIVPLRHTFLKIGMIGGSAAVWVLTIYLFRNRRWVRGICLGVAAAVAVLVLFVSLPGRAYDHNALRRQYVASLIPYEGTIYIWGGGSRLGIDCSGLVQRGLIDAYLQQAFTTRNPQLARDGLSLWWHTCSARALGNGYRNETYLLATAPSLNEANYGQIVPGDIAVMADGDHTLTYIGNRTWIEAGPTPLKVFLAVAPRPADPYFCSTVRIMRWSAFSPVSQLTT